MRSLLCAALVLTLAGCSASSTTTGAGGGPTTTSSAASSTTPDVPDKSPIDGVYRTTITVQDGISAGLSNRQAGEIDGVVDTTFSFGQVTQFINGGVLTDGFMGSFLVDGDRVTLTDNEGASMTMTYELHGGRLSFTIVDDPAPGKGPTFDAVVWTSHPWERR